MSLSTAINQIIFIHKNMSEMKLTRNTNLLISPQFYTIKKEYLPSISSTKSAKKIAHSLFLGLEDEHKEYKYIVSKDGENWVFISYASLDIVEFVTQKNIDIKMVKKIYFAQQILPFLDKPFALDSSSAIVNIDGIATTVSTKLLSTPIITNEPLSNIKLPYGGVRLSVIGDKSKNSNTIIVTAVASMLLGFLFIYDGVISYKQKSVYAQKTAEVLSSNPKLESSYIRDNIIAKYSQIDKRERSKRVFLETISKILLQGNGVVIALGSNEKNIYAKIKLTNPSDTSVVKQQIDGKPYGFTKNSDQSISIGGLI